MIEAGNPIGELVTGRQWDQLPDALRPMHPSDIADVIIAQPTATEGIIFRLLSRKQAEDYPLRCGRLRADDVRDVRRVHRPQSVRQLVPLSPCYQFPDRIACLDHAAHGRSALGWMVCGDDWVRATLGYDATSAKTRRGDYYFTAGKTYLGTYTRCPVNNTGSL